MANQSNVHSVHFEKLREKIFLACHNSPSQVIRIFTIMYIISTYTETIAYYCRNINKKNLNWFQCCEKYSIKWHYTLPAKVPLLRHSLMRLALRTWKALVISWFMKLSLFRTFATIIRRSNTSRSSAMVATCIRSLRLSSRLPVYKYWSTA